MPPDRTRYWMRITLEKDQRIGLLIIVWEAGEGTSSGTKVFYTWGFDANPLHHSYVTTDGAVEIFNQSRTVWNYAPSFNLDINPSDSARINMRYSGRTGYQYDTA